MNFKSIFRAFIPIGILLFFVLKSELKTEGSFGGFIDFFKYLIFLFFGILIFVFTFKREWKKIKQKNEVQEAKIIMTILLISTSIAICSFWFPKDYFDKEPEFIAIDNFGTKLTLGGEKFMLRTYDYEWTTIDRGIFKIICLSVFFPKIIPSIRNSSYH